MLGPNQQKWVDALRSGEYKQAKGTLYNKKVDGYCCLGVACRLMLGKDVEIDGGTLFSYPLVKETLAMSHEYGMFVDSDGDKTDLTELNDKKSYTFAQIADVIEQNAEQLFTEPK